VVPFAPRNAVALVAAITMAVPLAHCGQGQHGSAPEAETASVGRSLRRLSRREYNNVVRDLLGDATSPANAFGLEVYPNGFDNGSDGLTIQGVEVDEYQTAAESLAASAVTSHLPTLIGSCDPQKDKEACVTAFLSIFVPRAYRRPPTDGEIGRLRSVYAAGAAMGGFTGGLRLMVEAVLQSPAFLYREELGAPDPTLAPNLVRLGGYEVASELSFLVTGSMPDATLLAAVQSGAFETADDRRREAVRLLASPAARPALRSFLHQWMATDQVASTNKDAATYPTFGPAVAASMAGELDRYFDQILWSGSGSLRELFTSTASWVDPTLASTVYHLPAPVSGFQPLALDPQVRRGILTRAGFLAAHADTDSSGPIPRGVFVLGAILCAPPRPPPANVPAAPPPSSAVLAHKTTRERFDVHVSNAFCQSCHKTIDGVGFGFEQFDGIGAYRTTENGQPVDTSGVLVDTDVDGPFVGASELAGKLVNSRQVLDCFARQAYRYAMGQEESAPAATVLDRMSAGLSPDSAMVDVLLTLVSDPAFVLRATGQQ
jgi:hypothetical protein